MEKNLIENLKFCSILKFDFDIFLKQLKILIRSSIGIDLYKFYELKVLMCKELHISSEIEEILARSELHSIMAAKENEFYSINLKLIDLDLNINILCREFEWSFLAEGD